MKAKKCPPARALDQAADKWEVFTRQALNAERKLNITEAFFIEGFSFSPKQRLELSRRGITGDATAKLEEVVAELKGYYASDQAFPPRRMRKELETLHNAIQECVDKLDKTDASTKGVLNGAALPKTGVSVAMLRTLLAEYGGAARKSADRIAVSGPEASKDDHVARAVGEALAGIPLDDSEKGQFVIATGIVFEVMDIHKHTAKNAVQRALKSLRKAD